MVGATITYAVIAVGIFAIFAWLNWQAFVDYITWTMTVSERAAQADPENPDAVMAAMMPPASVMGIIPAYTLMSLLFYLLFAAYEAACLRWMIRGEAPGLFGLSLGADTWRVYFSYWIWLFLGIAIYIVILAVTFGMVGIGVAMSSGSENGALVVGLIAPFLVLGLLLVWLYVAVRFAPAAATSVARKRFAFFEAWKVTKGRFWGMFGAFALVFLMYFVFVIVCGVAASVIMGVSVMAVLGAGGEPQNPEEVFALLATPQVMVPVALIYAVIIVAAFMFYMAMFGINARAAALAVEEGKIQGPAQA
ncbi:MAG: hypothetical protein R3C16_00920 [Hyphomonadaceae bacterium]